MYAFEMNSQQALSICVSLCEAGINPEALAAVVKELRRESSALQTVDVEHIPFRIVCAFTGNALLSKRSD